MAHGKNENETGKIPKVVLSSIEEARRKCEASGVPSTRENLKAALEGKSPRLAQWSRRSMLVGWALLLMVFFDLIPKPDAVAYVLAAVGCGAAILVTLWRAAESWG